MLMTYVQREHSVLVVAVLTLSGLAPVQRERKAVRDIGAS